MVPNHAKHHYNNPLTQYLLEFSMIIFLDIFEDFLYFSPNAAAKAYLKEAVKKRRNVLTQVVEFVNQILNTDTSQLNPKHKDGALHVIGSLAQSLVKVRLIF